MSKKKTILIAVGILAAVGAVAAVSAQGHRGQWRHGLTQFGEGDGFGLGGYGGGGMRGRFGGSLTKDEFDARTRERFARLDRNSDGVVDAAEFEAAMTGRMSRIQERMGGGLRMGERLIRMFDTNNDGRVTKDEFQAGIKKRFGEMDLNNDGRITDEDLPPLMRGQNALSGGAGTGLGMGRGMGFPMLRWLQDVDTNKDGVITLDEAQAAADKRFVLADRNKDGIVDKSDFDALRKEMIDYRVKRFIHHFGADKDGKVTREQFAQKAQERFAQMDLNNDGTIARDERPGRGWFGRGHGGHGPWHRHHGGGMGGMDGRPMMGPGGADQPGPRRDQ